jgi:AraC family ethanolamine operon transcriptional activator
MGSLSAIVPDRTPLPGAAPGLAAGLTSARGALFPAGLAVDVRTSSGEPLLPPPGWDIEYVQLETGRCVCRRTAVHTARMQLCLESWSLGVLAAGRVPRGAVTFLLPLGRGGSARVQRRPAAAGEVAVLFDGAALDYRSAGASRLASVTIESSALEGHVHRLFGRGVGELRLQGRLSALRTEHSSFQRLVQSASSRAASQPRLLRDHSFASALERTVVKALLSEFEGSREPDPPSHGRALARNAEAFLRQNRSEPPTIAALCDALHASERTLHEAFREHLGTTPKAYLKTLRLNAARHDLLMAAESTRVTDVALDWGFLHFGWFSQDYRRLFGETPSQTLHRGRANATRCVRAPASRSAPPLLPALGMSW